MAIKLSSYCLEGLSVLPVSVEVDVRQGMPHFSIIGMAGKSVMEAKDRVRSAINHSGLKFPLTRKIVNLAPAEQIKHGSHFDAAIALGILLASGQIKAVPEDVLVIGELGLEGGVRRVRGALPAVLHAKENGFKQVVLPHANLAEASLVKGIELVPVKAFREIVDHFSGRPQSPVRVNLVFEDKKYEWDFGVISGHSGAKRALCVAAAGGHHVLMSGSPGTGKSLLARAFASILPKLSHGELLEVLKVYSISSHAWRSGMYRPFRAIHQSLTPVSLIGGGPQLLPGEVSLAHRGVLFADEFPEFPRALIELLRQPLEEKRIHLRRGHLMSTYPCQFQLLAAMNPCPCGFYGDRMKACVCSAADVARYRGKLSGPLLDRIDIQMDVPRVAYDELQGSGGMNSVTMLGKVEAARERMRARLKKHGVRTNQEMSAKLVKSEPLSAKVSGVLKKASEHYALSGRAVHKIIKVARTIADLDRKKKIESAHLMEALQYRVR